MNRLAEAIQRWLRAERLSPGQVARYGGISRQTIYQLLRGEITQPTVCTLRKLSVGLATDPHTRRVDEDLRKTIYIDFLGATQITGDGVVAISVKPHGLSKTGHGGAGLHGGGNQAYSETGAREDDASGTRYNVNGNLGCGLARLGQQLAAVFSRVERVPCLG